MASNIGTYSKAVIRKCSVNGVDITQSVRMVYTGSSIMTPWNVGKILVVDGARIQDGLYNAGVPMQLVYSAGDSSKVREIELVTMGNLGGMQTQSNRVGGTELMGISQSYFNMQNEHTSYHQNVTASDALKKLHKEVDSRGSLTVTTSKGMIGDIEPFHLRGVKLGQGANNIRSRMTDEKYKSGAYVYYKDQDGQYYSMPFEELMDKASMGGTTFTKMPITNTLTQQGLAARNIFAMRKGANGSDFGSDNATNWQQTGNQRGGVVDKGFDFASMEYKKPDAKEYDPSSRKTAGKTQWQGEKSSTPQMVNHNFYYDKNQKSKQDFEGDVANRNVMSKMAMQGSMTVNVSMEGGLQCKVGTGCALDIPAEVGTGYAAKSSAGGNHLIIAMGEYIMMGDQGMQGIVSLQTSSGGKQGSMF
jgi:hypothetical protein